MLLGATVALLLAQCSLADYATASDLGGWQLVLNKDINLGPHELGYVSQVKDSSSFGVEGWQGQLSIGHGGSPQKDLGYGWNQEGWQSNDLGWTQHDLQQNAWQLPKHDDHAHHTNSIPISTHIEVSKPIAVPVIKNIGIPLVQPIGIPVTRVQAIGVPQPYPVQVPVAHPVAIPVIKTVATIVEKKVPYPVEKIIPVPIIKHVPYHIEKHIPAQVEKHYPIHTPEYEHILHKSHERDEDD